VSYKDMTNLVVYSFIIKNSTFSLGFLFLSLIERDSFRSFLTWNHPAASFFPLFQSNKWFSHKWFFLYFCCVFSWFCRLSATLCCLSSCAALFDFASCCGVRLFLLKDQLQSITNSFNDLDVNVADPKARVLWWFRFYHIICRHFAVVYY